MNEHIVDDLVSLTLDRITKNIKDGIALLDTPEERLLFSFAVTGRMLLAAMEEVTTPQSGLSERGRLITVAYVIGATLGGGPVGPSEQDAAHEYANRLRHELRMVDRTLAKKAQGR